MAAIAAGRRSGGEVPIVALDGARQIGAKILISGGGRCNVTHEEVHPADFHGSSRNAVARILRTFDVAATVDFFEDLGVRLKREETGKLFPVTDDARTVLEALLGAARAAGVDVRTSHRVTAIRKDQETFRIATSAGNFSAGTVILATGGRSIPKSGSDGFGYELAKSLGHSVSATTPALVPLLLPKTYLLVSLSGISVEGELTLGTSSGRVIHRERGPILFTHFGLSGPAVLDMSRHWIASKNEDPSVTLQLNLLDGMSLENVREWLTAAARKRPRALVTSVLQERLPERLAAALVSQGAGLDPSLTIGRLEREGRLALIRTLVALKLPVTGDRGFNFAEVTAGGVPLSEIDPSTMASRKCPGLYLCGEILDVDGRIGGYNFQWAWASGRLAGASAGEPGERRNVEC